MFTTYQHQFVQNNYEKLKATTPATAQSVILSNLPIEIPDIDPEKEFYDFGNQQALFRILEQKFEELSSQGDEKESRKESFKSFVEEDIEECSFKVILNIKQENQTSLKLFTKTIIKTIDCQDETTLIFDRQHEKLKLQEDHKYVVEIFLESQDGFSRSIWKQNFDISHNLRNWSVLPIASQKDQLDYICLNVQAEKIGKVFIKPLSVKMPIKIIEQFFDLKLKLLNKSDLLSTLETIVDLKGILLPLTKQNMGSRIIQKLLTRANQYQVEGVIQQLKNNFKQMIFDRYGNYVFQKIFKVANQEQRNYCFNKLQPDLIDILQSKQGTHSIQSLIDNLHEVEIAQKFSKFTEDQLVKLSTNKFSMHFIQKLFHMMPRNYLFPVLIKNFKKLSIDKQGIVVLKSFISDSQINLEARYQILAECQNCINEIAFAEFGHYIVQEMLKYYNYYQLQNIMNYMVSYASYFSQNQYSSSIIRKFIDTFGDSFSILFINSILQNGLIEMMESSSGQFILHRLMEQTVEEDHRNMLISKMMVLSKAVKCYEKRHKWLKFFKISP